MTLIDQDVGADLSWYVDRLNGKEPFTLSRYGDGEWSSILGKSGKTCDGQIYYPELRQALIKSIREPLPYLYGIGGIATRTLGKEINDFLEKLFYDAPEERKRPLWVDVNVFLQASRDKELFPLVKALRGCRILYVGPERLRQIKTIFPIEGYVDVPLVDAFSSYAGIFEELKSKALGNDYDVIGFSAGPTAKPMIYDLWPFVGHRTSLIDFGSLWDIYLGYKTRKWHFGIDWKSLRAANTVEREGGRRG